MNISNSLNSIARALDQMGDVQSSDFIMDVMFKVAQTTPPTQQTNPPSQTQPIVTGITKAINHLVARKNPVFGKEGDPSTYQKCTDAVYDYLFAQSGMESIPDAFNSGKFVKRSNTAPTGLLDKVLKDQSANTNYSLLNQTLLLTVNLIKSSKSAAKSGNNLKSGQKHVYNIYLKDNFIISKIDSINTDGSVINSHLNTAWDKALGSDFLKLYKNGPAYVLGGLLNIKVQEKISKLTVGARGTLANSDISTIFEINNPQITCADGSYIQVNKILMPSPASRPTNPASNAPALRQRNQYPNQNSNIGNQNSNSEPINNINFNLGNMSPAPGPAFYPVQPGQPVNLPHMNPGPRNPGGRGRFR